MYHQDLSISSVSDSSQHHTTGDLTDYIDVTDESTVTLENDQQLNNFSAFSGVNLNIPLTVQDCEVESSELDQYLPSHPSFYHQYQSTSSINNTSPWTITR